MYQSLWFLVDCQQDLSSVGSDEEAQVCRHYHGYRLWHSPHGILEQCAECSDGWQPFHGMIFLIIPSDIRQMVIPLSGLLNGVPERELYFIGSELDSVVGRAIADSPLSVEIIFSSLTFILSSADSFFMVRRYCPQPSSTSKSSDASSPTFTIVLSTSLALSDQRRIFTVSFHRHQRVIFIPFSLYGVSFKQILMFLI